MKSTASLLAIAIAAVALSSCSSLDPEYAEYKKQKEAEASGQSAYGGTADPYGAAAAANPYGAPGQGGSDVGTYTPQTPAPYQPLPSAGGPSADPYSPNIPSAPSGGYPTIPGPAPSGPVTTHVVVKGDSLWGLSRKYGTTADAIRQANGMTNDTVVLGTTLQIPTR